MAGVNPEVYPGDRAVYRFAVTATDVEVTIDGNALKVTEHFVRREEVQFALLDRSTLNIASMHTFRTPRALSVSFLINPPAPAPAPAPANEAEVTMHVEDGFQLERLETICSLGV